MELRASRRFRPRSVARPAGVVALAPFELLRKRTPKPGASHAYGLAGRWIERQALEARQTPLASSSSG